MLILKAGDVLRAQADVSAKVTIFGSGMTLSGATEVFTDFGPTQVASTGTDLYTVAGSTQLLLSTIHIVNTDAVARTIAMGVGGAYSEAATMILPTITLQAGEFAVWSEDGWKFYAADGTLKTGLVGPAGTDGAPGATGTTGQPGQDGDDGVGYPGAAGVAGVAGAAGALGPMGPPGDGQDGDDGWTLPGPQGPQGIQGIQGPSGSGGGSTIIQNTEDDDGGFPRSGEPSPLVRELMQSNSTPSNNEIVRIGWSAVVEGLPLTINVGQIIEIATDGLLTLDSNAGAHDHASPAWGDVLRPRILQVGMGPGGEPDITLSRSSAKSLNIDSDGTGTLTSRLTNLQLGAATISESGSLWSVGSTAFPTSPAADNLYYRTDLDMWFFYDGTRWLSSQIFTAEARDFIAFQPYAATNSNMDAHLIAGVGTDIWFEKATVSAQIVGGTALDASNKWVITAATLENGTTFGTLATFSTAPPGANRWRWPATVTALNSVALWDPAFDMLVQLTATKTGTPGTLAYRCTFTYRLVAT